jgi:hypothetical protein
MPAARQSDQSKPHRKPRRPKVKSTRGRGGDHTSLRFRREQARVDGEVYRMVAEGFQLSQAAGALGINEDAAGESYRRALASMRLATVAEAKALALDRIRYRRTILHSEIRKRVKANGSDPKKLFDSADLKMLFDAANQLDVRESRLVGLDAPLRSLVAWVGVAPSEDLLTAEQLNRLSVDQLRQLHSLLAFARDGHSIDAESHHVADADTLNFQPTPPKPAPEAPPVVEPPEVEVMRRESGERYRPLREAEQVIAKLNVTDPTTRIGDPIIRSEMARQANEVLIRFGRKPWREWMEN